MASGLAVAQRFAIQCRGCARHQRRAPTRGRMPGAAPDRRAWKQVSATARDQRALPDRNAVSQLRPDLHGRADAMPRRAPASAKSSLVRAPPKSIPPRNAGALGGWLQQRSGVQTQFWSVPFIGDSLLQVNRNCLGRASNAVEHSLGKGEVVSFNPYRQPHFYWLSSTSSLTQLCNSVRNDPGTCGSGRRGNFDSLPLRSPSLHAAVALGVDFRKLRAQQKYLR